MNRMKQKGSAVLLGLVFLALLASFSAKIMSGRVRQIEVMQTAQNFTKHSELLLGGEAYAKTWMLRGRVPDEFGHAVLVNKSYPLDGGGKLDIHILDLQACINVNSLNNAQLESITRERLRRLSSMQGIDQNWIDVLVDWVDADNKGKYEDTAYKDKGYKVANSAMVDRSEWNLLDMPIKDKSVLEPFLCSLPAQASKMDINAVSRDIMKVYFPSAPDSTLNRLQGLIADRQIGNINELANNPSLLGLSIDANEWTTKPQFVEVLVKLTRDKQEYWLDTKLALSNGRVNSFFRSFNVPSTRTLKLFGLKG